MTTPHTSFKHEQFFTGTQTFVDPTALLGPDVILEPGVKVGAFSVITGNVKIGAGTKIYPHVSIGFSAQALGVNVAQGSISIGKNCEIREYSSIHASKYADGQTRIGDNCYIMCYAHVSHDATLENNVILTNNVSLGGHTYVEHNAVLMAYSATHQFCRVGKYSALAPFSGIRQDAPPFCLFDGKPAHFVRLNAIGLRRAGITSDDINALKKVCRYFYQDKKPLDQLKRLQDTESWGINSFVQDFIAFIETSERGVSRRSLLDENKINPSTEQ
ncbi:MAG: acyl-ACP--UDP-N-acetylglucosamine O-acyltransferase [Epsilonproteobacteria bacterium]|nr:acyl-ACP--UDP-N-acetylglucosamine O-acyltransferase [Campylobacterota bacterium]